MGAFFMCVLQYVIIMIGIGAVGFCGAKVGLGLRKNKDKNKENK